MNFYLEPTGGIAGDMFVAAVVHAIPEYEKELLEALSEFLPEGVDCSFIKEINGSVCGLRFIVKIQNEHINVRHSLNYSKIRTLLNKGTLQNNVRDRALNIFQYLALAESTVHGVPIDDVHFHEIADWDSIADIVAASWLIEKLGASGGWGCASVPVGSGRIKTSHGVLPVPAPATAILLKGVPVFNDQIDGERVTPTGAAILCELDPVFTISSEPMQIQCIGYGLGSKILPGIPNILRFIHYDKTPTDLERDQVLSLSFNIDDQTPEELAVSLDTLRNTKGVIDVLHSTSFGKKGRVVFVVEVVASICNEDNVLNEIFNQTTTIGIRQQILNRKILSRKVFIVTVDGKNYGVKSVTRPSGNSSSKAESDDIVGDTLCDRRALRNRIENKHNNDGDNE